MIFGLLVLGVGLVVGALFASADAIDLADLGLAALGVLVLLLVVGLLVPAALASESSAGGALALPGGDPWGALAGPASAVVFAVLVLWRVEVVVRDIASAQAGVASAALGELRSGLGELRQAVSELRDDLREVVSRALDDGRGRR